MIRLIMFFCLFGPCVVMAEAPDHLQGKLYFAGSLDAARGRYGVNQVTGVGGIAFKASDVAVETRGESRAYAYSNGGGIYVEADSSLYIPTFTQGIFSETDHRVFLEPSPSISRLTLRRGLIAICSPLLTNVSVAEYETDSAIVSIPRLARMAIRVDPDNNGATTVYLMEGACTVISKHKRNHKLTLFPGQEVSTRPGQPLSESSRISQDESRSVRRKIDVAYRARRAAYFVAKESEAGGASGAVVEAVLTGYDVY